MRKEESICKLLSHSVGVNGLLPTILNMQFNVCRKSVCYLLFVAQEDVTADGQETSHEEHLQRCPK